MYFSIKIFPCHLDLISSSQPIIALTGDDVILPCCLEPATSVSLRRVEWTSPDLDQKNTHIYQDGRLVFESQNPSYNYRTRLFVDELMNGNVSMKIFGVKLSDEGKYRCSLPSIHKEAFVRLIVGKLNMRSACTAVVVGSLIIAVIFKHCIN